MSGATAHSTHVPMVDLPKAERRGLGELRITGEARRTLPLAGVSIRARVGGRVAQVEVEQRFQNPFAEPLEATYIFPLAGGCAVGRFELQVGSRILRGKVEERGAARRQYQRALEEGKRAALLEQERDDVFTVQVGNLPPGEEVIVRLSYSEKLPYFDDGMTELRLPLVVAPRYIAGQPIDTPENAGRGTSDDTDQVPDASRITPPRLAPGFDPKVALRLAVELLHGPGNSGLGDLACSQHATRMAMTAEVMEVSLASNHEPLDRDFVLRWRVAGEKLASTLLVHRGEGGEGFGLLSLVPPRGDAPLAARDVVFVVDRSGSMEGQKIASAARACSLLLGTLGPRDRFTIQAFDTAVEWMDGSPRLIAADEAGIVKGEKWLRGIDARGGTEIEPALAEALKAVRFSGDSGGRVPVVVLLTDGEIGSEGKVLARIQQERGETRIFTVGIDTAVNSGFLKKLAQLARGTASFVEPGAALEDALRAVAREIGQPLVIDLSVEDVDAGLIPSSAAPSLLPDLFAGRAASCSFRFAARSAATAGSVRVKGRFADGRAFEQVVAVRDVAMPGLAHVWARAKVSDLEDAFRLEPGRQAALRQEIIALALEHTLLTRFTAFVVVDETEIVNKTGERREVTQPVETPAGWAKEGAAAHASNAPASPSFAPPSFAAPSTAAASVAAPPVVAARMAALGGAAGPGSGNPSFAAPAPSRDRAVKKSKSMVAHDFDDAEPAKGGAAADQAEVAFDREEASADDGTIELMSSIGGMPAPEIEPAALEEKQSQAMRPPRSPPPAKVPRVPQEKPQQTADSAEERRQLQAAFDELAKALTALRAELAAGKSPEIVPLEALRKRLLALLASAALAQQVPAAERYVRAALGLLIAGLSSSGALVARQLLERQQPDFEAAAKEVAALSGGSSRGRFWESSI